MPDGNDYYTDPNGQLIDIYGEIPADACLIAEHIKAREKERKREAEQ